jgi:hypothetical protein
MTETLNIFELNTMKADVMENCVVHIRRMEYERYAGIILKKTGIP